MNRWSFFLLLVSSLSVFGVTVDAGQKPIETGTPGRSCVQLRQNYQRSSKSMNDMWEVTVAYAWVDGYILGATKAAPIALDATKARQEVHAWMTKYCELRPNTTIGDAVEAYVSEKVIRLK